MARKNKPLPAIAWLKPRVKVTRWLSLSSFLALIALLLVWNLVFADLGAARPWVIISFELAALLVIAPWMLTGSAYAHTWASFISNLYFIKGVLAVIDPSRFWLGLAEITLSVLLFISTLFYARWRSQLDRAERKNG